MNTPGGNTVSTAEQTITLLMALARHIPAADASVQPGQVGTQQVRRHPARRQDARRRRPGPHRPRGRPPGRRPGHEGRRLRSVPGARPAPASSASRACPTSTSCCRAVDFLTVHTPLTDETTQPDRRRQLGHDAQGRARHQLCPRRHHQRGGPGRGAAIGPSRRGRPRCVRAGAAAGRSSAAQAAQRRRHAAPGRLHRRGPGVGGPGSGPAADRLS